MKDSLNIENKGEKLLNRRQLRGIWRGVFVIFSTLGIILALVQLFFLLNPLGISIYENSYYYGMYAIYLPLVFLLFSARPRYHYERVPWYDIFLFLGSMVIFVYFALNGVNMYINGWMFTMPTIPTLLGIILSILVIEAVRRSNGLFLALLCLFFLLFPMFGSYLPSPLTGLKFTFLQTMSMQSMGSDGLAGMPIWVFSTLLIGFMMFGEIVSSTKGGKFFIDFSLALMGTKRGGPAKVSILASGLFGMVSGVVISNILTTGTITIPTMKKVGYPAHYAAAVETNASTGGVLMPPVMGAVAFVMAMWLGISYVDVCIAAAVPAFLYFYALIMQVDAYAAKKGLIGLSRTEIPSLRSTLKSGWFYIFAFILLIYFLVYMRLEEQAPFYAGAALLFISMINKSTRMGFGNFIKTIENIGKTLVQLVAIFAGISFLIGGLTMTGVASALAGEIVRLAGGNSVVIMLLGAITGILLGTGMPVISSYVFLALVLAPALVNIGFNSIAVHLFVIYYAMLSFITPPVCLGAYTAAGIAGASPMKTGFHAMRLGMTTYLIPFFFVINPALIMQGGSLGYTALAVALCVIGIGLICGAFEGYLWFIGKINVVFRGLSFISGILLMIPEMITDFLGAFILLFIILFHFLRSRRRKTQFNVNPISNS
jgi:TRAP transporter 4TM/12TM fusion protein